MRIPYGMVGGGPGAFIGPVHRMAAALDGELELVAGAFSAEPARAEETGRQLGLARARVYASYQEMARREAELPPEERIRLVSIVTPNHLHHPVACTFLEHGIHVVCEKPLATSLAEAEELCRLAAGRDLVCAVTFNYTGYPMVEEARARIRAGELGRLRKVVVEYSQGWLARLLEAEGHKQAAWRGDPERAGPSSALGDIGSHAHNLVRYVTGLEVRALFADLGTVVEGRRMEDDATVIMELEDGVRGLLFCSQIATGERNHLRIRVYGADGGLDWSQEQPERLRLLAADGSERIVYRGAGASTPGAAARTRLPSGHPEGFIEAFANLYREIACTVRTREEPARLTRATEGDASADDRHTARAGQGDGSAAVASFGGTGHAPAFPTVTDGTRGVHFVERALESHRTRAWVDAAYTPPS